MEERPLNHLKIVKTKQQQAGRARCYDSENVTTWYSMRVRAATSSRSCAAWGWSILLLTGWELRTKTVSCCFSIDNHHKAVDALTRFLEDERFVRDEQPIADGGEAFDRYTAAAQQAAALRSEIARLQKPPTSCVPGAIFRSIRFAS